MKKILMVESNSGELVEIPSRIELCHDCKGAGTVDHPAFSNGITSSEWADMDEDSQETYMRGGYDVPCGCCKGSGRVLVPDAVRLTFAHKRVLVHQRQNERGERDYQREVAAERRYFEVASRYFA